MEKGHLALGSKASHGLKKGVLRPKCFMLIEDIYMHYMYDPWVDVPFLFPELGQNMPKAQNLTFK